MYPELLETTILFFNQIHWGIGPSKNEKFSFEDRAQASRPPAVQARGRRAYSSNCMVVANKRIPCSVQGLGPGLVENYGIESLSNPQI